MNMLHVEGNKIVDSNGKVVSLKGTCIGGWMNMENFINGYPGSENGIRSAVANVLGPVKGQHFFDRMLDYFFNEDDIAFLKECGCTVVRLPLNYRHFEDDEKPFEYKESGFKRLDKVLGWCEKYGIYAILDLHSVQGWQNNDWHCDNDSYHTLFWNHPHFQHRFIALWEEFARRYKNNATVAGYDVMNEPICNAPLGRYSDKYIPNWELINKIYRQVVKAIRDIDPDHIIFLEGDCYSRLFDGLDEPFADNLVYSSHNYTSAGFGPGAYPGIIDGDYWDRQKQLDVFLSQEGTKFAKKYNVPLWVGEFGSVYNGPSSEKEDRLRALDDQLDVFDNNNANWTTWTYKDVGVMGWVMLNPESDYMQIISPVLRNKLLLDTDFWMRWLPSTPAKQMIRDLARLIEQTIGDPDIEPSANQRYLNEAALACYTGTLMQPSYAKLFKGMSEDRIDSVLQSFSIKNCIKNEGLIEVVKKHMSR